MRKPAFIACMILALSLASCSSMIEEYKSYDPIEMALLLDVLSPEWYVYAANRDSGTIYMYSINNSTGLLTDLFPPPGPRFR